MKRVRTPWGFNVMVVYACVAIVIGVGLRVLPVEDDVARVLHVVAPIVAILGVIGLYFAGARGSLHESARARDYGMRARAVIMSVHPTSWTTEDRAESVVALELEVRSLVSGGSHEPYRVRVYRDLPKAIEQRAKAGRSLTIAFVPERRGLVWIDWDSLSA